VTSRIEKPPSELLRLLRHHDRAVQALALGLRTVVLRELAPCHEYVLEMRSKIVFLYVPTSLTTLRAFDRAGADSHSSGKGL
jgi:hypothetical protein